MTNKQKSINELPDNVKILNQMPEEAFDPNQQFVDGEPFYRELLQSCIDHPNTSDETRATMQSRLEQSLSDEP